MHVSHSKSLRRAVAAISLSFAVALGATQALADAGFQRWVRDFRGVAAKNGISGTTFDRAFRGVDAPDPEVLEKARYQPEFTAPVWDYFDNRVNENSVEVGRAMARKYSSVLSSIERRFGVDRHILLAIWSMESNYGEALKNDNVRTELYLRAMARPTSTEFSLTRLSK